uniref:oligosaccharide flippase family protein n=1 Tax=Thaumasiovibrio occultus TaxID=1891184 RepID=UPI000B35153F|nr:oligosaccharide flippase family protein [Thaumasiovibrio occultus]
MSGGSVILNGTKWAMIAKWYSRLIGLVSTIVLARLLSPTDFGTMALAMFFLSLFLAFSATGTTEYIVREHKMADSDLNCVWSIGLVTKTLASLLLLITSPLLGRYLNNDDIVPVIQVVSVLPFIQGLRNPGLDVLERQFNFRTNTLILMSARTVGVAITLTLALTLKSYWAMVVGSIATWLVNISLGYRICAYRPCFSLKGWRQHIGFSQWLYLKAVTGYLRSRIDVLILGNIKPVAAVGSYNLALEFAWLPYSEIVGQSIKGLYSSLSATQHDKAELIEQVRRQLYVSLAFIVPCAVGLAILAEPFVLVVLGEKWRSSIELIPFLAFGMIMMSAFLPMQAYLMVTNQLKYQLASDVLAIVSVIALFYWWRNESLAVLAQGRTLIWLISLSVIALIYWRVIGFPMREWATAFVVPMVISVVMALGVTQVTLWFSSPWLALFGGAIIGAVIYVIAFFVASHHPVISQRYNFLLRFLAQKLGARWRSYVPVTSTNQSVNKQ